ncbi:glycosyltransferase family 1 protein [Rothia sp. CCM 9418]|uniref:glycosyltransferase family 1 protein n=1 Tax=Rothia sp. CCM 9418 TaxID=3402661 RepID=UPI003ADDB34E
MKSLDLIVAVPDDAGWAIIRKASTLLGEYLGVTPHFVDVHSSLSRKTKLLAQVPKPSIGKKKALVIAYDPGQLNAIAQSHLFLRRYQEVYGWVIDSFWTERIPAIAKQNRVYKKIFITDFEDIVEWNKAGVKNVSCVPWGTDVWSNIEERLNIHKSTDLLRVGRQPQAWDNDSITEQKAHSHHLHFEGRPPFGKNAQESERFLQESYQRAKVVLAFSNKVSPAPYTHPTKEYITGRWLDALSWGCFVAGRLPNTEVARRFFAVESCWDISPHDVDEGLETISAQLLGKDDSSYHKNIIHALKNLDWRHRFQQLCQEMNVQSHTLVYDIQKIDDFLCQYSSPEDKTSL